MNSVQEAADLVWRSLDKLTVPSNDMVSEQFKVAWNRVRYRLDPDNAVDVVTLIDVEECLEMIFEVSADQLTRQQKLAVLQTLANNYTSEQGFSQQALIGAICDNCSDLPWCRAYMDKEHID